MALPADCEAVYSAVLAAPTEDAEPSSRTREVVLPGSGLPHLSRHRDIGFIVIAFFVGCAVGAGCMWCHTLEDGAVRVSHRARSAGDIGASSLSASLPHDEVEVFDGGSEHADDDGRCRGCCMTEKWELTTLGHNITALEHEFRQKFEAEKQDAAAMRNSVDSVNSELENKTQEFREKLEMERNETAALRSSVDALNFDLENKTQEADARAAEVVKLQGALDEFRGERAARSTFVRRRGPVAAKELPKRAYITMAHDSDPSSFTYIWQVLALARAIQRVSLYPLVLMTDVKTMPDGQTPLEEGLRSVNVHVIGLKEIPIPSQFNIKEFPSWKYAFWKLQIWNLTNFDKLVWLDSDAIVTRNLDWLFDEPWIWGQRDDWFCKGMQPSLCSGLLSVIPDEGDFKGIQAHAASKSSWQHGDQELIESYFKNVKRRPVQLLLDAEASFGQCVTSAPSAYANKDGTPVPGAWSTPAFVHKSGGFGGTNDEFSNVCFSPMVRRQYFRREGHNFNACHFHPLGPFWRELFCEAVMYASAHTAEMDTFCDDGCWYRGRRSAAANASLKVDDDQWCRPMRSLGGLDGDSYFEKDAGGEVLFQ